MKILAIETSCDDTGIAVIEAEKPKKTGDIPQFRVLSNIVSSQTKIHEKYGGVYPSLAKREHQRNLPTVFAKALKEAGFANSKSEILNPKQIPNSNFKIPNIDLIAVTVGPGLEPCLWQGVNFANDLAEKLKKPLIAINHIEAHIAANFIGGNSKSEARNLKLLFPVICLVVSGGHTQLILMKKIGKYEILGETRDDAAGECFDKTARILGLAYPGGPVIAQQAAKYKTQDTPKETLCDPTGQAKHKIQLPRPMIQTKDYDFSFSGLKTAVLYLAKNLKAEKKLNQKTIQEICFEIQQSVVDVLLKKTIKAAKDYRAKSIILAGGVSANEELRKQLKEKVEKEMPKVLFSAPELRYCTDNAAMIGAAAFLRMQGPKKRWKTLKANANLRIDETI